VKDKDEGKPLEPLAAKMNEMAKKYYDTSRPLYCARHGFVDEIVNLSSLRSYLKPLPVRCTRTRSHLSAPPDAAAEDHQG